MLRKAVNLVTLAHYVLMNKNTPVLSFDYDLGDHKAVRSARMFAPEAAPFGFVDRRGDISKAELNYWWRHRAIPASRAHVKRLLENLQLESTLVLAEKELRAVAFRPLLAERRGRSRLVGRRQLLRQRLL